MLLGRFPLNILCVFKELDGEIIAQTMVGIKKFRNLKTLTIKYFKIPAKEELILEVFFLSCSFAPHEQCFLEKIFK
jgi:hypothetical protein